MRFRVRPESYVLWGFPRDRARAAADLTLGFPLDVAVSLVVERDGVTAFVPESATLSSELAAAARREACQRLITFEAPMAWDVVGFLALVTRVLAEARIPVGAICGFDKDHVFVHERHLESARAALRAGVCAEAEN